MVTLPDTDGQLPTRHLLGGQLCVKLPPTKVVALALKVRPLLRIAFAHKPVRRLCKDNVLCDLVANLVTSIREGTQVAQPMRPVAVQDTAPFVKIVRCLTFPEISYVDAKVHRAG